MSTRKIKNAVNNTTGELIYFKGHAKATFMSDGSTVEDAINNIESKIDLSDYVKSEELEGYAKTEDIPSLEGYAKTEDIPSVDGFVKSEDLPNFDEFAKTEDIPSLDGYATEQWVNNKNYATEYDLKNIDYSSINNVPVSEDETGEFNIADESGNVGMKVASEAVYAKDFVAGEHKLSEKVDTTKLATINGQSLTEGGNIKIGGKEYVKKEKGGIHTLLFNAYEPMEPNKVYYCTEKVYGISINSITPPTNDVAEYLVYFTTENNDIEPSEFLSSLLWANGVAPTIEMGVTYELSIVATKLGEDYIYKAVLTPFKSVE